MGFGLSGCPSKSPTTKVQSPTSPPDPWVIVNLDPNEKTPALLWNGLIGLRVGSDLLTHPDGALFDIDRYQATGEEKIQPQPNPVQIVVDHESNEVTPSLARDFRSQLDLRTGMLRASWTEGKGNSQFKVESEMAMHPDRRMFAQRWKIVPSRDASLAVGFGPEGTSVTFRSIVRESGSELDSVERVLGEQGVLFRARTIIAGTKANSPDAVRANQPITVDRTWSYEPSKPIPTFSEVSLASTNHWSKAWQTDIQIDGPVEDQQFVRSALFYLRSSIHPKGKMSVSPMGLSSDLYGGHVFWDADIWVFPALALINPNAAKAIPDYRLRLAKQAMENHVEWLVSGKPTGSGLMGKHIMREDLPKMDLPVAMKFPWESSVSGKETVPGPSRFQDHISGSVAWSVNTASSLGLDDPYRAEAVRALVKRFYDLRSTMEKNGLREIKGTMSPDENHIGDNDLYTNLLAMWCQSGRQWPAKPTYKLPRDDKTFLTYDNDGLRGYKQAAAVLSIWPLQYPPAEAQGKAMMERFADKVTRNGPAMSDSVHALIWARLGEKDKAYLAWHNSWKPFVKPPFLLFSEKRNSSRTYFTTGAAGSLNAVIYGFAGIRIDDRKAPGAQWSTPLKNGKVLSIAPNLPKEWRKLTLKNLTILGKKYTFEIEGDRVKVS